MEASFKTAVNDTAIRCHESEVLWKHHNAGHRNAYGPKIGYQQAAAPADSAGAAIGGRQIRSGWGRLGACQLQSVYWWSSMRLPSGSVIQAW